MATINIKAREAFYNLPDLEGDITAQKFAVNSGFWPAQVFLSRASTIDRIFFMCDDTEALEVEIYSANVVGDPDEQNFEPDTLLASESHPESGTNPFEEIELGGQSSSGGTWRKWELSSAITTTIGSYFLIIFKTTSTSKSPTIFWTGEYRQALNPIIIASTDSGATYSNDNIETITAGNMQGGAICFGYVGEEVDDVSTFLDSGTSTIGGLNSARRGYPVFLFVENLNALSTTVSLNFAQIPPGDPLNGTSEETDQAMMEWYFVEEGVIPVSGDLEPVLFKTNAQPQLDLSADFVIFMQPDRLSPLADPYYPETTINTYADPIGIVPIYSSSAEFINFDNPVSDEDVNSDALSDVTDRFGTQNWAHFRNKALRATVGMTNERDAGTSQNPSYVDFSTESPGQDVELIKSLTLSGALDTGFPEEEITRGFNRSVFYKDSYLLFSKKSTQDLVSGFPDNPGKLTAYTADSNITNWQRKVITFSDSSPTTLGTTDETYIIGVHDAIVVYVQGVETLFVLLQTMRTTGPDDPSAFDIGYYQGDLTSSTIAIQLISHETSAQSDGGGSLDRLFGDFDHTSEADIDSKTLAKFIVPNNTNSIFFTASVPYDEDRTFGLGLWKIGLSDTLSASYSASIVKANTVSNTGISEPDFDKGISFVLHDGSTTYLGVRSVYDLSVPASQTIGLARIYRTNDFVTFEQLLGGKVYDGGTAQTLPDWLDGYHSLASEFDSTGSWPTDAAIANTEVRYMTKIGDILHAWISPPFFTETNTPMHVAIDVVKKTVKTLRAFPIEDAGDSNYDSSPKISDLEVFKKSKSLRWIEGGTKNGNQIYIYGAETLTSANEPLASTSPLQHERPTVFKTRWVVYDDRTINHAFERFDDSDFFITPSSGTSPLSDPTFVGTGIDDLSTNGDYDGSNFDEKYLIQIDGQALDVINGFTAGTGDGSGSSGNDITVNDARVSIFNSQITYELEVDRVGMYKPAGSPFSDLTLSGTPTVPYGIRLTVDEEAFTKSFSPTNPPGLDDLTINLADAGLLPDDRTEFEITISSSGLTTLFSPGPLNPPGGQNSDLILSGATALVLDYTIRISELAGQIIQFDGSGQNDLSDVTVTNPTEAYTYDLCIEKLAYDKQFTSAPVPSTAGDDVSVFGDSLDGFVYKVAIDKKANLINFIDFNTGDSSVDDMHLTFDISFNGTGTDDLSVEVKNTEADAVEINEDILIEIDAGDPTSPNTFKWSKDGGATFEATGVSLTTYLTSTELGTTGVFISFGSDTGHDVGDQWGFQSGANAAAVYRVEITDEACNPIMISGSGIDDLEVTCTTTSQLIYTIFIDDTGNAAGTLDSVAFDGVAEIQGKASIDSNTLAATTDFDTSGTLRGVDDFTLGGASTSDIGSFDPFVASPTSNPIDADIFLPDFVFQIEDLAMNQNGTNPFIHCIDMENNAYYVIDTNKPNRKAELVFTDNSTFDSPVTDIFVQSGKAYIITSGNQDSGINSKLFIFDISEPRSPSLINTGGTEISTAERGVSIFVSGITAYIAMDIDDNLGVYEIIGERDRLAAGGGGLGTVDRFIVITNQPHGLSDGDTVLFQDTMTSMSAASGTIVFDADGPFTVDTDDFFVNGYNDRFVIDGEVSTAPGSTNQTSFPVNGKITQINGSDVSIRSNNLLKIFDISDSSSPVLQSSVVLDGFIKRDISTGSLEIEDFNFTEIFKTEIVVGSETKTIVFVPNNKISDGLGGEDDGNVSVIDATDSTNPIKLTPITVISDAQASSPPSVITEIIPVGVHAVDNYLFICCNADYGDPADDEAIVMVYDFTDPENIVFVDAAFDTALRPHNIYVEKFSPKIPATSPTYDYLIYINGEGGRGNTILGFNSDGSSIIGISEISLLGLSGDDRNNNHIIFNEKTFIGSSANGKFRIIDNSTLREGSQVPDPLFDSQAATPTEAMLSSSSTNEGFASTTNFDQVSAAPSISQTSHGDTNGTLIQTVGTVSFDGSALTTNDLNVAPVDANVGVIDANKYLLVVEAGGTTFKWSNDGGDTFFDLGESIDSHVGVGNAFELIDPNKITAGDGPNPTGTTGIHVYFDDTVGNLPVSAGDCWKWEAGPQGVFHYRIEIDNVFSENVTFTGSGLNDLNLSGTPAENKTYKIIIDSLADQYGYGYGYDNQTDAFGLDFFDVFNAGQPFESDPYGYGVNLGVANFGLGGTWEFEAGFATGSVDPGRNCGLDTWCDRELTRAIAEHNGKIYVGVGNFETSTGTARVWENDGTTGVWNRIGNDINSQGDIGLEAFTANSAFTLSGSVATDFNDNTSNITIFFADLDYIVVGADYPFSRLEVSLITPASANVFLDLGANFEDGYEYYDGSSWQTFRGKTTISETVTNAKYFQASGNITWTDTNLTGDPTNPWIRGTVGGVANKFWIRVQRNNSSLVTSPIEGTILPFSNGSHAHFGADKAIVSSLVSYNSGGGAKLYAGLTGAAGSTKTGADIYEWDGVDQETGDDTTPLTWTIVGGSDNKIPLATNVKSSWATEDGTDSPPDSPYKRVNAMLVDPYNSTRLFAALGGIDSTSSPTDWGGQVWRYTGAAWSKIGGDAVNSSWSQTGIEDVFAMVEHEGDVAVGLGTSQDDTTGPSSTAAQVWIWNNTTWTQIADGSGSNGSWTSSGSDLIHGVYALFSDTANGFLYAGIGSGFNDPHGTPGSDNDIAEVWRWDGATWTKIGDNSDFGSNKQAVEAINIYEEGIHVGVGRLDSPVGPLRDAEVWRFVSDGQWVKIGGDGVFSSWDEQSRVFAMQQFGGSLYVGLGGDNSDPSFGEVYKFTKDPDVPFFAGYDIGYEFGAGDIDDLRFVDTFRYEVDGAEFGEEISITGMKQSIGNGLSIEFSSVGETREDIIYVTSSENPSANESFMVFKNSPLNSWTVLNSGVDLGVSDRRIIDIIASNNRVVVSAAHNNPTATSTTAQRPKLHLFEINTDTGDIVEADGINSPNGVIELFDFDPFFDSTKAAASIFLIARPDGADTDTVTNASFPPGGGTSKIFEIDNNLFFTTEKSNAGAQLYRFDISNPSKIIKKKSILDTDGDGSESNSESITSPVRWIRSKNDPDILFGLQINNNSSSRIFSLDISDVDNVTVLDHKTSISPGFGGNWGGGLLDTGSSIATVGNKGDITEDGNYIITACGQSFTVLDVSDPTNIQPTYNTDDWFGLGTPSLGGTNWTVNGSGNPFLWTEAAPTSKYIASSKERRGANSNGGKIVVFKNHAFRIRYELNLDFRRVVNANRVDIVDISDPTSPSYLGEIDFSAEIPDGIDIGVGGGKPTGGSPPAAATETEDFIADLEISPFGFMYVLHRNETTGASRILLYDISQNIFAPTLVSAYGTVDYAHSIFIDHKITEGHTIGDCWSFNSVDTFRWTDDAEAETIVWNEENIEIKDTLGSSSHDIENLIDFEFNNSYAGGYGLGDSWAFTTVDRVRWAADTANADDTTRTDTGRSTVFDQDRFDGVTNSNDMIPIPFEGGSIEIENPYNTAQKFFIEFSDSNGHALHDFWRLERQTTFSAGGPGANPATFTYQAVDPSGTIVVGPVTGETIPLIGGTINIGPTGDTSSVQVEFTDPAPKNPVDRDAITPDTWTFTTLDRFSWTDDATSSTIYWNETEVDITAGQLIAFNNNVDIFFDSNKGHKLGDAWEFSTVDTFKTSVSNDGRNFIQVDECKVIPLGGGTIDLATNAVDAANNFVNISFDSSIGHNVGDTWVWSTTDAFKFIIFSFGYGYGFGIDQDFFDVIGAAGGTYGYGFDPFTAIGSGLNTFESIFTNNYGYGTGYEYGLGIFDTDTDIDINCVPIKSGGTNIGNGVVLTFDNLTGHSGSERWFFDSADSFVYEIDGGGEIGPFLVNDEPQSVENGIFAKFTMLTGFAVDDTWTFTTLDEFDVTKKTLDTSDPGNVTATDVTSGIAITTAFQDIGNGIEIKFGSFSGHDVGDTWTFKALDEVKAEYDAIPDETSNLSTFLDGATNSIIIPTLTTAQEITDGVTATGAFVAFSLGKTGHTLSEVFEFVTVDTFSIDKNSGADTASFISMTTSSMDLEVKLGNATNGISVDFTNQQDHRIGDNWLFTTVDTFKYSKNDGSTFIGTGELIDSGAISSFFTIDGSPNNVSIQFTAQAGHDLNDKWTFFPVLKGGYKFIEGKGVYHGKTLGVFNHDESSIQFKDYPALSPDEDSFKDGSGDFLNPRVNTYIGMVSPAGSTPDNINNDSNNIPIGIAVNSGITYMFTNNDSRGLKGFKTYGVKELPENWGRSFKVSDTDLTESDIRDFGFADLDNASFELAIAGTDTYLNVARRAEIMNTNNVLFVSEMKSNTRAANFEDVDASFPQRAILAVSNGLKRPQELTMFFNMNYLGDLENDTVPGGSTPVEDALADPSLSDTVITIKCAQTIERLFYDPQVDLDIPLAQIVSTEESNRSMIRNIFSTDTENNFFRIESSSILSDDSGSEPDEKVDIRVKATRLHDITLSGPEEGTNNMKAAANGIVQEGTGVPENALENGVNIPPDGEIIIDFAKPIYVSEINFDVEYFGADLTGANQSQFNIYCLPKFGGQAFGPYIVDNDDWVLLGTPEQVSLTGNSDNIKKDAIGRFIQAIRIELKSGVTFQVSNLTFKSFSGTTDQFTSSGDVSNAEMIVVDDIQGIVNANPISTPSAYATLNESDAYIEVDFDDEIPVTRISMNVFSGGSPTRTIEVDVWDGADTDMGSPVFENVYTGSFNDYEFSIVQWTPKLKDKSREVRVNFLDDDDLEGVTSISDDLKELNTDNSGLLPNSGLTGFSFRPNSGKDRSLTVSSSNDTTGDGYDGSIFVNAQMDEDGPFSSDIGDSILALLEKNLNIDFPLKQIRKVRITLKNQTGGEPNVRVNGLKMFSPIVDENGDAEFPRSGVLWTIRLTATLLEQ